MVKSILFAALFSCLIFPDVYASTVISEEATHIQPKKRKKIVIDAGHGGHDSGAVGKNSYEKDLTLSMALKLGKMIQAQYPDLEVLYTRQTDVFIPLYKRVQFANEEGADLFISIHCNFIGNRSTRGTETFVMGLHRADDNLEVAKRENASILLEVDYEQNYEGFDPNSPEGHIMMSLYQNAYLEKSIELAAHIEKGFEAINFTKSRGVKQAGFAVLRRASMPAVLVEAGFISNEQEEAFLMSEEGQHKICEAMFDAVGQHMYTQEQLLALRNKKPSQNNQLTAGSAATTTQETPPSNQSAEAYRVQIAALKNATVEMDSAELRKIGKLHIVQQNEINKYLVGDFNTAREAAEAREKLKKIGYSGAFIVSPR